MSYKTAWFEKHEVIRAIDRKSPMTGAEHRDLITIVRNAPWQAEYGSNWESLFRNQGEHAFANVLGHLLTPETVRVKTGTGWYDEPVDEE